MQSAKSRTIKPRFPIALAALAATVVLAAPAAAAPGDLGVAMVKDINPTPGFSGGASQLTLFNGIVVFVADNGSDGQELWRTDGTAAGTVMVKDINPGADEDPPDADSSDPEALTVAGDAVYFRADDGVTGEELWKTDGTTAGTTFVKDINPGEDDEPGEPDRSSIDEPTDVDGTLLFEADDGVNGIELWKSDGTPGGTQIVNGPAGIAPMGASSTPNNLEAIGSTLYFGADDTATGMELWKVGPPYSTATQVADINSPGTASSAPGGLTDLNGTLLFAASTSASGRELWKSTGGPLVPGGTELVKDIDSTPTSDSSNPSNLIEVDGTLFFFATDGSTGTELWKSDGGTLGTQIVADINTGPNGSGPAPTAEVKDTLFFAASDPTNGLEPWKSDGGPLMGGTHLIADIRPGLAGSNPGFFGLITEVGGAAFFSANDGSNGEELWRSDGGPLGTGTRMVADINATAPNADSLPGGLLDFNGTLLFRANDGINGAELWRTVIEGPAATTQTPAVTENPECAALRAKLKKLKRRIKKADNPDQKSKLKKKRRNVRRRLADLGC
jgi:ELWxxDGT repeat protein